MTPDLARIHHCRGCGAWRYTHDDLRPCTTCLVIGHWRAGRAVVGA